MDGMGVGRGIDDDGGIAIGWDGVGGGVLGLSGGVTIKSGSS
jgi:hypothetical protein